MITVSRRTWTSYSKAAGLLRHMIVEGAHEPEVLDKAAQLVSWVPPTQSAPQAQAIWAYVRNGIYYLEDPRGEDHFQMPSVTMKRAAGDCDDQAVLLGALLRAAGFRIRLVFVFRTPPKNYEAEFPEHVYLEVDVNKYDVDPMWVCAETIPMPDDGGGFKYATFGQAYPKGYREFLEVD